jgi:hypothetical protein
MPPHGHPTAPSERPRRRRVALLALVPALALGACGAASSTHRIVVHDTHPYIVAAVAACRRGVDTAYWLSPSNKANLDEICEQGFTGGINVARGYAEQACEEVAFTSPAKSSAQKAAAFHKCFAEADVRTTATP